MQPHEARLNITWNNQNGDLPDPVNFDSGEGEIIAMAQEAIRQGGIPGIDRDINANLAGFKLDRFPAKDDRPWHSLALRPKVQFG
jgi:hypothetical protein